MLVCWTPRFRLSAGATCERADRFEMVEPCGAVSRCCYWRSSWRVPSCLSSEGAFGSTFYSAVSSSSMGVGVGGVEMGWLGTAVGEWWW